MGGLLSALPLERFAEPCCNSAKKALFENLTNRNIDTQRSEHCLQKQGFALGLAFQSWPNGAAAS